MKVVRSATAVGIALGAMVACTKAPAPTAPSPPRGERTITAVGLKDCATTAHNPPKFIVRIMIKPTLDDVFGFASGVTKAVFFNPKSSDVDDNDFNDSNPSVNMSRDTHVNGNIFHSDLILLPQIQAGDVVEYRLILKTPPAPNPPVNPPPPKNNIDFYTSPVVSGIDQVRGVAVGQDLENFQDFICSYDVATKTKGSDTRRVARFLVTFKRDTMSPPFDAFSIALAPKNGATETPVLIDPKILNNGIEPPPSSAPPSSSPPP